MRSCAYSDGLLEIIDFKYVVNTISFVIVRYAQVWHLFWEMAGSVLCEKKAAVLHSCADNGLYIASRIKIADYLELPWLKYLLQVIKNQVGD